MAGEGAQCIRCAPAGYGPADNLDQILTCDVIRSEKVDNNAAMLNYNHQLKLGLYYTVFLYYHFLPGS